MEKGSRIGSKKALRWRSGGAAAATATKTRSGGGAGGILRSRRCHSMPTLMSLVVVTFLLLLRGNQRVLVEAQQQQQQQGGGNGCDICGSGLVVGSPSSTIQDPVNGDRITCGELQVRANLYTYVQCLIVQSSIVGFCGCRLDDDLNLPTTEPPVLATDPPDDGTTPGTAASCSVCDGEVMGSPNSYVRDPQMGDRITCAELDERVANFNFLNCQIAQASSASVCMCGMAAVPVTDPPAVAATDPPAPVEVTPAPVPAATPAPVPPATATESPESPEATDAPGGETPSDGTLPATAAPTTKLPAVTGRVSLELKDVAGAMREPTSEAFEKQTTSFLRASLAGAVPPVRVYGTTVVDQAFTPARRRQLRARDGSNGGGSSEDRALQSNLDFRPLLVTISVDGGQQSPDSASFSNLVAQTINANPDRYISYLNNATPPINQVYFKSVESVSATTVFSDGTNDESTPTDPGSSSSGKDETDSNSNGGGGRLSGGAIAGIVIGSLAGGLVLIGAGWYLCRRSNDPEKSVEGGGGSTSQEEAAPSSKKKQKSIPAPQGKLGLILKSSVEGAEIHHVKPESPLYGKLFAGDTIIRIDCEDGATMDTTSTSVNEVSAFMSKTKAHNRVITVLSDNSVAGQEAAASVSAVPPPAAARASAKSADVSPAAAGVAAAGTAAAVASNMSSTAEKKLSGGETREIIAPAGKLGIVIDTSPEGQIVRQIKAESPMKGILKTGEIITLIDDVDTRGMSAADVNQVMADKVGKEKILAVWSSTKVMSSSVKSSEVPKVTKKAAESSQKPAAAVVAAAPVTATVANFTPKYGEERRVVVGPGKLGIVIDTTADGPIVHEIRENSPLRDRLCVGDLIGKIDDMDVLTMSAASITAYMVKTMDKQRVFIVKSRTDPGEETAMASNLAKEAAVAEKAEAAERQTDQATGPPQEIVHVTNEEPAATGIREVVAPPGKLGIVVDTSMEGPVVNQVLPTSPLKNKLKEGDVILSINGQDTRAMEGSEITEIMIKTANENRTLQVQSES